MNIGLIDVDGHNFPNLALMKISAYHKARGDKVDWANPLFGDYDRVYKSKVFRFTSDIAYQFSCETIQGGTGYDIHNNLSKEIDHTQPDYAIYPFIDNKTAYGFLTRGCPNKCKWCVVPRKEGDIKPYMDVEEIAINGRTNLVLMENNILACDYGLAQIEKIIRNAYRVDFNQALDARLVTDEIANLLARVRWIDVIRFGCDTPQQIVECENAMAMIDRYRGKPKQYLIYTMIYGNINDCYSRLMHFRDNKRVRLVAQPFRDYDNPRQEIPQWQRDMCRWAMRREIYASTDFKSYIPRKGFTCKQYFE